MYGELALDCRQRTNKSPFLFGSPDGWRVCNGVRIELIILVVTMCDATDDDIKQIKKSTVQCLHFVFAQNKVNKKQTNCVEN